MKSKFENLLGAAGVALALSSVSPNVEAQEPPKNTAEQKCERGVQFIRNETGGLVMKVTWSCPGASTAQPAPSVSAKPAAPVSTATERAPSSEE